MSEFTLTDSVEANALFREIGKAGGAMAVASEPLDQKPNALQLLEVAGLAVVGSRGGHGAPFQVSLTKEGAAKYLEMVQADERSTRILRSRDRD